MKEATFATTLRRTRQARGFTLKQLAGKIRLGPGMRHPSLAYLNDLERGKRGAPPFYLVEQLARALGAPTLSALARRERAARWTSQPPVLDELASSTP